MTLLADQIGALTISSAFLVASLSIVMVIYVLQWNYFYAKEPEEKDRARDRTLRVFSAELGYIFFAATGLLVNGLALMGIVDLAVALSLTVVIAAVLLLLVT